MRKSIKQMMEHHYPHVKFKSLKEVFESNKIWKWQEEGWIAISTASADKELAELADMNGCLDGEYMLTEKEQQR